MVGRNEKCPCGSGKKYKHCCIDKIINHNFNKVNSYENIPGNFFSVNDPYLQEIKSDLKDLYHLEKKNPHFLANIGYNLGTLGYVEDAILYCEKALKLVSKNELSFKHGLISNIAAMYSQSGKHEKGLSFLKLIPDGVSRKIIIEANIRKEIESWDKIVPLYQKAIEEEPDFFLPYEHIITRTPFSDPKREFLIETAFKKMPKSPIANLYWADKEILMRNYKILADDEWINKVRSFELEGSKEETIVGFSKNLPNILNSLELIHEISKIMNAVANSTTGTILKGIQEPSKIYHTETNLDLLFDEWVSPHERFSCNIIKNVLDAQVTFGRNNKVKQVYKKLCSDCKKQVNLDEILFSCHYRKLKLRNELEISKDDHKQLVDDAFNFGQNLIKDKKELSEDFVNSYLDFLDDEKTPEIVMENAKKIFDKPNRIKFTDNLEELRLYWNLGIIAGRANLWNLSENLLTKTKNLLKSEVLSRSLDDKDNNYSIYKKNALKQWKLNTESIDFYLTITNLAQNKFAEAEVLIKKIDKILVKKNNLEKEYSNLINLKNWVKVNNKSNTFKNDFRKQLQKSYFSFWYGDKPKLKSAELQIADIISLNKENSISSIIKVHETLDYHQNLESKDISPIVNILEELISNFRILPPNASKSLVAAETYKINSKSSFDTAPSIMSYCKSLEIYLKDEVFGNYIKLLNHENKLSKYIEEASQDKNFNQFKSLIVFIKSGFLELGSAVQCLKLSKGKTASRIKLLGDFNNYLQRYFKVLLDDDKVKMISMLSSKYRNPAVHEKNFQIEDLNIVRSIVAQIFNELLSLKLVKSS